MIHRVSSARTYVAARKSVNRLSAAAGPRAWRLLTGSSNRRARGRPFVAPTRVGLMIRSDRQDIAAATRACAGIDGPAGAGPCLQLARRQSEAGAFTQESRIMIKKGFSAFSLNMRSSAKRAFIILDIVSA